MATATVGHAMYSDDPRVDLRLQRVFALSDMGHAVQSLDWAATPLGAIDDWPEGLRLAVSVCLSSRFPMLVTWGPDLIKIYNDGYRPMLGSEKHPGALGSPAQKVWPEIWEHIGPLFESVMATGVPTLETDQELILERNGYPEQCFFTFSFSALFDRGEIGGVLCVASETTGQIVDHRRLEGLSRVQTHLVNAEQVTDVCARVAEGLAGVAGVRECDIYLHAADDFVLVASTRRGGGTRVDVSALLTETQRTSVVVGGDGTETKPAGEFVVPIGGSFGGVRGAMVFSLSPQRPFDAGYRTFLTLIADVVTSALDGAYRRTVEIGEYRRISDTLQAAMLKPVSDLPTVAARYLPAVGRLAVGGDWYDVIDMGNARRGLIVGDCVGHGLEAATVMAQLRSAARAMILEGRDPAAVLDGLSTFASSIVGAECASVVCAVFDRNHHTLAYSRAGHPPPLIVNAAGVTWLDDAGGPLLSIDADRPRSNAVVDVDDDDVLVLYSDGLIERRGESLDTGFDRLAAAVTELYGDTIHHVADGLVRLLSPETTRDDVVLVVKQLVSTPPSRVGE
jgi:stage II sporulation SpoE-like protein